MNRNRKTKASTATTKQIGAHSGQVTHHHDQAMTLVNLRTRNTKKRRVPNPMPLVADAELLEAISITPMV